MIDPYFEWLCDLIRGNDGADVSYSRLLRTMYEHPFYPVISDDENRVADAVSLRKEWGSIGSRGYGECNMLELAIGLARRVAYLADSDAFEDDIPRWFWELIENAGLDIYTDLNYDTLFGYENVNEILTNIVERDIGPGGEGSFFPIESPFIDKDYRIEPMRVQMNDYVRERYPEPNQ